jgi:hypothetical protein
MSEEAEATRWPSPATQAETMLVRSDVQGPRIVVSPGAAAAPTTAAHDPVTVNDLILRVWTGQANHRLLFDCGEGCPSSLSASEIRSIDAR